VPDSWHDQARGGGAGARIVPALQRVLDLQLQLRGEVLQIDAGGADEFAVGDEAVRVGPVMPLPAVVVTRAEDLRRILDPQAAERQLALGRRGAAWPAPLRYARLSSLDVCGVGRNWLGVPSHPSLRLGADRWER